jgi:hypothetical protein
MDIFATLGDILRPENSKQEFIIWERLSPCTLEYQRHPGGIIAQTIVKAESPEKAIDNWLLDKYDAYGISLTDQQEWTDDASGRIVWEKGDTSADFGDYMVFATEVADIEAGSHLEQACIKAGIIEPEAI